MRRTQISFAIVLIMTFFTFAWAAEVVKVEQHHFKMRPGGFITVIGDNGLISVKSWDKSLVELKITKRAWDRSRRRAEARLRNFHIDIDCLSDRLVIRYINEDKGKSFDFFDLFDPDKWRDSSAEVEFELLVPKEVDLRLENDEGDIEVVGVSGDIQIEADEGDVLIRKVRFSDLDAVADEGSVEIIDFDAANGRLTIDADEGDVIIENGITDNIEIDIDEGDAVIQDVSMQNCAITADEGDIEVDLPVTEDGDYYFDADEGDVRIWLDSDSDIELDLETQEGGIRGDFRLSVQELGDDGERVTQRFGRGSARLQAVTDEGAIILRKR